MYLISSLLAILVFFFQFSYIFARCSEILEFLCLPTKNFYYYCIFKIFRLFNKSTKLLYSIEFKQICILLYIWKEREMKKKSSQNFLTFDSWILLELLCLSKVFIYKSCHEPFLLVQCATYTFQPSQSCNFKKIKVYETKLFINNIIFASFLNLN